MTEKVKVSQEVADAIEYLEKVECDFEKAMELHVSTGERIAYEYNYHQKRAKEEKSGREKWVGKGYVRGVQRTLKNLNIIVKGVNDGE